MTTDDDADEKWEKYPGHTRAKHNLLKYYLDIWIKMLGDKDRKIRIFDCFAGRGEYYPEDSVEPLEINNIQTDAEIHGSPQIILDLAVKYSGNVGDVECVFIEKKEKNASILKDNLPDNDGLPETVSRKVVSGKFQDKTIEMVRRTGCFGPPTFFFIDPFGYSALEYDTVTEIASKDQFEVLINLMAEQVVRWQDADKQHEVIQIPFGQENWREELEKYEPEQWDHKAVGYYCKRLEENGPDHTLAYLVTEENTEKMKYYLVFGTNSDYGMDKMRDAMQNCGPGEFAFAPQRSELSQDQATLGEVTEEQKISKIKSYLLDNFSNETKTFDKVVREISTRDEYWPYNRGQLRKAAKELEEDGKIDVMRVTSKTERGLGGDDLITF